MVSADEDRKYKRAPPLSNAAFDIVAMAASAGGLTALSKVLASLPSEFPAPSSWCNTWILATAA
jgi:two-component system chemotaxis response regulator CheB